MRSIAYRLQSSDRAYIQGKMDAQGATELATLEQDGVVAFQVEVHNSELFQ